MDCAVSEGRTWPRWFQLNALLCGVRGDCPSGRKWMSTRRVRRGVRGRGSLTDGVHDEDGEAGSGPDQPVERCTATV